ncbi:thioredoxin [Lactobacillus sp. 0.1XD8-4]|uniref:Thioredoxin n=1 Tax=Limosilactobacillus walteri TaxID=2268022 RepID=A0ABR8P4N1_9LACO|nr:thioredoxin [Limosilactobacillus walteri]MBD5805515.1 thioredoxin [Limosilactobacillus walteri]MRN07406.1 thioredoxin [Lactobacillus sp. 0.1XD8-4]
MAINATAATFDDTIQGPLTIVDFWAPWCGPCKMMEPAMQKLEKQFGDKIKFVKMNVDGNQAIAQEYKVMSVPSLVLFRDGEAKEKVTGFYPEAKLAHYFERKIAEK